MKMDNTLRNISCVEGESVVSRVEKGLAPAFNRMGDR